MKKSPHAAKRVLILVQNLPVPFDRRVWMEATTLQQSGYSVTVICPRSVSYPRLRETLDGIVIRRFPLPFEGRGSVGMIGEYAWSLVWMSVLTLWETIRNPVTIVHVCNPPDLLVACAIPAKMIRRSRVIFDQHDLGPELWEAKGKRLDSVLGRLLSLAELATYRFADIVISTNESYKQIALSRGGKSDEDVFIVRSAPRLDFAVDQPSPARVITSSARLVYLGTMGSQEGIELLLEAMNALRDSLPQVMVYLDLIGDGPERSALEVHAAQLGIAGQCVFHGRVSDRTLRDIVMAADLAVNPDRPSKMNDLSSMNKIVEYMALGVPLVQFACTEGGRTAREAGVSVVEPTAAALAESIAALLGDVQRRSRMKEFGWHRFKTELCWETQVDALLAGYQNAVRST